MLMIVGLRLKISIEDGLRFADGLKCQLLISHRFLPFAG
jgi:hypothetical protein